MGSARETERRGVAGQRVEPPVEGGVGGERGDRSDGLAQVQTWVLRCAEAGCCTTTLGMANNDNCKRGSKDSVPTRARKGNGWDELFVKLARKECTVFNPEVVHRISENGKGVVVVQFELAGQT